MSGAGPPVRQPGADAEGLRSGQPLVIAHRGASAHQPENTLPAYALAVEQRADMIEIDLHTTLDGVIAISHDAELDHIGGSGEIGQYTLAELRELDAGDGERIPTLDEVLDRFAPQIPFNLELKMGGKGAYAGMERAAVDATRSRGILDETLFSSFYDGVLAELRAQDASVRLGVLVSLRRPQEIFERAAAVGAEAINPFFTLVDSDLMARARDEGLAVYPYTVDEPEAMERMLDLGVNGLFTNHPDRMRAIVDGRERSSA